MSERKKQLVSRRRFLKMVAGTGGAALLTGCGGGLFTQEPTSTPTGVPEPTSLPDPTMTPTAEVSPTATATIESTPTEVPATSTATSTPEVVDHFTPPELVDPVEAFEGYDVELVQLHVYKGKGEFEGIEVPIYTAYSSFPYKAIDMEDRAVEAIGQTWLFTCYYRYRSIMGNSDTTFEEYLDLVRQNSGKIRVDYIKEDTDRVPDNTDVDPRNGVLIIITGDDQKLTGEDGRLPLLVNPLVGDNPLYMDIRVNDRSQPVITMSDMRFVEDMSNSTRPDEFDAAIEHHNHLSNAMGYFAAVYTRIILAGGSIPDDQSAQEVFQYSIALRDQEIQRLKEILGGIYPDDTEEEIMTRIYNGDIAAVDNFWVSVELK